MLLLEYLHYVISFNHYSGVVHWRIMEKVEIRDKRVRASARTMNSDRRMKFALKLMGRDSKIGYVIIRNKKWWNVMLKSDMWYGLRHQWSVPFRKANGRTGTISTEGEEQQTFSLDLKRVLNSKTENTCTMIKAPPSTLGSALHLNSAFNHIITYIPGCD